MEFVINSIIWFRRNLRLKDNTALVEGVSRGNILPVFIFDPKLIRSTPPEKQSFLNNLLFDLDQQLRQFGNYLLVRRGNPIEVLKTLVTETDAELIIFQEDYTPYALKRDSEIIKTLPCKTMPGQNFFRPDQILKKDETPYTIFTPYSKTWLKSVQSDIKPKPAPREIPGSLKLQSEPLIQNEVHSIFPASEAEAHNRLRSFLTGQEGIYSYAVNRNKLAIDGTSLLSPYIHFGVLSMKQLVSKAINSMFDAQDEASASSAETWLKELIWREFFSSILFQYPHVKNSSFRSVYNRINWRNNPEDFSAWKNGKTGYPVVDAAMRQLKTTGWMHNRGRMITASFLVKDLLIDWRWGEQWFMENLIDGDLSVNNGGWQWIAGTGTDAAPYFRIFNPVTQSKKFDPQGDYIRRWVPELSSIDNESIHTPWKSNNIDKGYPTPIIDHSFARQRAITAYQKARDLS